MKGETRKLAAIMFTDMAGFSRQMGADEARTLRVLEVHNGVIRQAVAVYRGAIIKTIGDAFLADFPSVVQAVHCAQQIQAQFKTQNIAQDATGQIHVRIGIHLGDIVQKDGDVFGDGVNIASRLQSLAEPDTICISHKVYEEVAKKLDLGAVVSLGRPKLKNIAERFQVYALLSEQPTSLRQKLQVQRLRWSRRVRAAHRLALVGVVLVMATLGLARYFFPSAPREPHPGWEFPPLPDKPSIVVMPFVNMSNDPSQDYFSDGITEDITSDLSKISSLFVIARNSAFIYKGKAVKVQDVSKELGVRYVLEGSVRKAEQVRITVQLINATTGEHLWSERYDRPLKDIFAVQDEITQQIVNALRVEVQEAERVRVQRTPTENLTAYDYVLRGWEYYHHITKEMNLQARQMFEKAIALDPQYAAAYAGLGWTYQMDWVWQWDPNPRAPEKAFELVQKAVTLDDLLPVAHQLLGQVYLLQKKQYEQALAEGERAVALDPNGADGYARLGLTFVSLGEYEKAVGSVEKAMRLNPHYPTWYLLWLGGAYNGLDRFEEAIVILQKAIVREPNFLGSHLFLAVSYSRAGRDAEAQAEVAEVLRLNPRYSLEGVRQRLTYKEPMATERILAALRKAGLK